MRLRNARKRELQKIRNREQQLLRLLGHKRAGADKGTRPPRADRQCNCGTCKLCRKREYQANWRKEKRENAGKLYEPEKVSPFDREVSDAIQKKSVQRTARGTIRQL